MAIIQWSGDENVWGFFEVQSLVVPSKWPKHSEIRFSSPQWLSVAP